MSLPIALGEVEISSTTHTVTATNFHWTPGSLTIEVGDEVRFTNGQGTHNWVSTSGDQSDCQLPCTKTYPAEGTFTYRCGIHPSMTGSVKVVKAPQVSILSPAADETVSGVVTVSGTASHDALTVTDVSVSIDGGPWQSAARSGPSTSKSWPVDWKSYTVPDGTVTLVARATVTGGVSSTVTQTVDVQNGDTIDLVAHSLSATTGTTRSTLTLQFANEGNVATGPFVVRYEYQQGGTWHTLRDEATSLSAFQSTTQTTFWDSGLRHFGQFPLRATLDHGNALVEVDETNNVAHGTATFFSPLVPQTSLPIP